MAEFGFETAPGISEFEREAVSMRRGSALQQALQATQAADGFFTPERALMAGPGALRVGILAEKARRDLLVNRAGQGISLAGAAISQRGAQKTHDSRLRQEDALRNYVTRTQGMTQEEAVADMTGEEAALPLVADFALRTRNDLDITKLGARQRAETGRRMDIADAARPPEAEEIEELKKKRLLDIKQTESTFRKLAEEDPGSQTNFFATTSDFGWDYDQAQAVYDHLTSQDSTEARKAFSDLGRISNLVHVVASQDPTFDPSGFVDLKKTLLEDVAENGSISGRTAFEIGRASSALQKKANEIAADRAKVEQRYKMSRIRTEDLTAKLGSLTLAFDRIQSSMLDLEAEDKQGTDAFKRISAAAGGVSTAIEEISKKLGGQDISDIDPDSKEAKEIEAVLTKAAPLAEKALQKLPGGLSGGAGVTLAPKATGRLDAPASNDDPTSPKSFVFGTPLK